jgi:predicted esterase
MTATELDFIHRYLPAQGSDTTLLLLHGTGGNEDDLRDLGRMLAPTAALLSPRGKVVEQGGINRFFRRLSPGVFDAEDVARRAHELADFVAGAAQSYSFDQQRLVAIGYSNGANIAAATLLLRPEAFGAAVLLHPMIPLPLDELPDLSGTPVLITAGQRDPITPPQQAEQLALLLESAGAQVTLEWQPGGHELALPEVQAATAWLQDNQPV